MGVSVFCQCEAGNSQWSHYSNYWPYDNDNDNDNEEVFIAK